MKSTQRVNDYLKYWRPVKAYIKARYKLSSTDLDVLLFLHSEGYFSRDKFAEYSKILPWDKGRFERLKKEGWIVIFRKRVGRHKTLYQISHRGAGIVNDIYEKLNGALITERPNLNPLFKSKVSYAEKQYRDFIIKMNETTKQLQRLALE
jgi:predicted ArsR family transcriptional regulator